MCAGVVGYILAPSLPLTLLAAMVCGTGGSVVVNNVNAALMDHQGRNGPAALTEANAGAAAIGTVAPLVVGIAVAVGLGWRAGILVTVLLSVGAAVVFAGVNVPEQPVPDPAERSQVTSTRPGALPRDYWFSWGVLVCVISVEFMLSLWASDLLRTRLGMSAAAATAAWAGLLLGFTVSRVVGSRLAVRRPVDWLLVRGLGVLMVGFALFWLSSVPLVAVLGLLVAGLGLGLQFPLTAARAIAASGGRSDLASARTSLAAAAAVGAGPFLLGALADHVGEHAAFLLVPVLVGLALVGLGVSRPPRRAHRAAAPPVAA
jgi:fucose permease